MTLDGLPVGAQSPLIRRGVLLLAAAFYAWTLHVAHGSLLQNAYWEYGFSFDPFDLWEGTVVSLLVAMGAAGLPGRLDRPSSVILTALFVVVYVPTVVITPALAPDATDRYGPSLAALAASFLGTCIVSRLTRSRAVTGCVPGPTFVRIVTMAWAACSVVLVIEYGSTMRLVGLDETYAQRAVGASTSLLIGYVQTYYTNVFSPGLIALGLVLRRRLLIVAGVLGCLIMYMIAAQRTVFLLPFVMFALHFGLALRVTWFRNVGALLAGLAATVAATCAWPTSSVVAELSSRYLVFRTIALPGLTFSQYQDVFGSHAVTWWSHVRGMELLVSRPPAYASDPLWPGLGYMVGDRLFGNPVVNWNANLFAGDGVAAAGWAGVLVIGVVLAIWLAVLDFAARAWDRRFAMLVVLPVALSLTNGHLTTALLSFGGLFWTLLFILYKPRHVPPARRGAGEARKPELAAAQAFEARVRKP